MSNTVYQLYNFTNYSYFLKLLIMLPHTPTLTAYLHTLANIPYEQPNRNYLVQMPGEASLRTKRQTSTDSGSPLQTPAPLSPHGVPLVKRTYMTEGCILIGPSVSLSNFPLVPMAQQLQLDCMCVGHPELWSPSCEMSVLVLLLFPSPPLRIIAVASVLQPF